MNYSNLTPEVKAFFIKDYTKKAQEMRVKASNPKARKAAEYNEAAEELESIVSQIKAAKVAFKE